MSTYAVDVDQVLADGAGTSAVADELGAVRVWALLDGLAQAMPGSLSASAADALGRLLDLRLLAAQEAVRGLGRGLGAVGAAYEGCERTTAAALTGGR